MFSRNFLLLAIPATVIPLVLAALPTGVKFRCMENSRWTEDCQRCMCRFAMPMCKPMKKCVSNNIEITPQLEAAAEKVREYLNDPEFLKNVPMIPSDIPYELTCIPGEIFRIGCDFCQCRNNGMPFCQNKYCPGVQKKS